MVREVKVVDGAAYRSVARLVYDRERELVFIETEGNHDGVKVCTAVQVDRHRFASLIRELGCM